jgi:putative inorganic carbon (hco3(-)) transporter
MILFYILVLTAPMPNHPVFEAPFAGLTVVKWLGIACCAYAFLRLLRCPRPPAFLKSHQTRFFLLLFGVATLSFFTLSDTKGLSFSPMFTYVSYVLLFFTTISVVNTYERLHRTLLAMIAGTALASLYVIREFQVSGGTDLRPGYVTGDSNYFAACAVLVIPIALYFAKMKTSRLQRWFCGVSVVLMLLAFTVASSRGGLVGLSVVAAYMIVRSGRSRRAAMVTVVLLLPMLVFLPASPLSRMLHPNYGDVLGAQIRRDFWRAGVDMVRKHPVTGIGLGNFTAQSFSTSPGAEGKHGMACNTFLEMAAELGILGFLAYCGVLGGALSSAGKLRSEGKRRDDTLLVYAGEAMQAGLLGFSAAAMFVSAEYQKPFWVIVALTATVTTLLAQHSPQESSGYNRLVMPRERCYATTKV